MQKLKNILHHDHAATGNTANTTHTAARDPIVHDHGTTIPNAVIAPGNVATTSTTTSTLDKNHDGRVDAADFQGRGTSTTHHNPLDRNHDGKVDLKDLKPSAKRDAVANDAKLASLDRNHDGRVDAADFQGQRGLNTQTGMVGHNPLDRNHDGRVDAADFQSASLTTVRAEPTIIEQVQKNVVVHEHIHPVEKEEIQPVIHREREQLEVKQITQQLHETQIQPTLIRQGELAAEVRAPIVERGAPIQENLQFATTDRDVTMRSVEVHAPIVNETIKRTVIEEIQPVLERDVYVPTLVQQTQNIYEKVVEAPTVYREVLPTRELGTRSVDSGFIVERQAPIMAQPIVAAPIAQPVTMTTTTTTTDSFIPAKLINNDTAAARNAPAHRKHL